LQGLIQIAVALHHHSRGNSEGTRSLLARAHRNLSNYPDSYEGVNLGGVRAAVVQCQNALDSGSALSPFTILIS
jgi:predicted metal-dependent hydrolase